MKKVLILVAGLMVLIGAVLTMMTQAHRNIQATTTQCGLTAGVATPVEVEGFTPEQVGNAVAIINQGAVMGGTFRDQVIGVMTAMGESSLINIDYGDWETGGVTNPDGTPTSSIGLFQQQAWWGTVAERMDPATAARLFFERELLVAGRETMAPTLVAHAVQINADPYYYTQFWDDAERLTSTVTVNQSTSANPGPWVVPLTSDYVITSEFGLRVHPIYGDTRGHAGMDLAAPDATPVLAAAAGTVSAVVNQGSTGYGLYIVIDHGDGVQSLYGHLSRQDVTVGQTVYPGQPVGLEGSTGGSTGPHLHFELRHDGTPFDPRPWMADHGVNLDGHAGQAGATQPSDELAAGCMTA
ncbi:MAG: M23 family metallopeptidase [Propionibacteriaceae bacterium]|jgi:murein DD-endopeptidase MepM/ murein hydrolase activator NlpD|nr:M23 family metallopeptidase [Propionibacteriaceae bacterium]